MEGSTSTTASILPTEAEAIPGDNTETNEGGEKIASNKSESTPSSTLEEELEAIKFGNKEIKLKKDDAKIIKDLQKWATQSAQQAAKERKQREQYEQMLEDPDQIFQQKKIDRLAYAEKVLAEELKKLEMSPAERRALELEQENKRFKEQEQQRIQQEQINRKRQVETYIQETLDKEIVNAFKSLELPVDVLMVKQTGQLMYESLLAWKQGKVSRMLTAKEAAGIIKEKSENLVDKRLSSLEDEKLFEKIGNDRFQRLKQLELKKLGMSSSDSSKGTAFKPAASQPTSKTLTEKEWDQLMAGKRA